MPTYDGDITHYQNSHIIYLLILTWYIYYSKRVSACPNNEIYILTCNLFKITMTLLMHKIISFINNNFTYEM